MRIHVSAKDIEESMNNLAINFQTQNEGNKFDSGKLRWDLIPWFEMDEIAKVYTVGAEKYGERNWEKGFKYSRLVSALMRHLFAWVTRRGTHDPESGLHHLASVVFYCFALMRQERIGRNDLDDRG